MLTKNKQQNKIMTIITSISTALLGSLGAYWGTGGANAAWSFIEPWWEELVIKPLTPPCDGNSD